MGVAGSDDSVVIIVLGGAYVSFTVHTGRDSGGIMECTNYLIGRYSMCKYDIIQIGNTVGVFYEDRLLGIFYTRHAACAAIQRWQTQEN